ncbi:hypothetical protein GCM10009733_109800 [Nonomuraea maheshkhaliensis]|uniref:Uncharacterized protein n=1 Tax=Nonomuraea maheshkhaliensis TaxID=419590 RepID=A0ABN2I053_9ACTN
MPTAADPRDAGADGRGRAPRLTGEQVWREPGRASRAGAPCGARISHGSLVRRGYDHDGPMGVVQRGHRDAAGEDFPGR